jgi:hypothetical protein
MIFKLKELLNKAFKISSNNNKIIKRNLNNINRNIEKKSFYN